MVSGRSGELFTPRCTLHNMQVYVPTIYTSPLLLSRPPSSAPRDLGERRSRRAAALAERADGHTPPVCTPNTPWTMCHSCGLTLRRWRVLKSVAERGRCTAHALQVSSDPRSSCAWHRGRCDRRILRWASHRPWHALVDDDIVSARSAERALRSRGARGSFGELHDCQRGICWSLWPSAGVHREHDASRTSAGRPNPRRAVLGVGRRELMRARRRECATACQYIRPQCSRRREAEAPRRFNRSRSRKQAPQRIAVQRTY